MLQKTVRRVDATSEFFPPADHQQILEAEKALKLRLPDELRSVLQETNGLTVNYGAWLVWPIERIREDNLFFRSRAEFRDLYMPFDHLLFVGEAGNGDQFAYTILNGVIQKTDIYWWDHETDSREWFARSLEDYFVRWLSNKS